MTNRFHTVEDATGQEYYQLPKELVKNPSYKELSANAKIAYCVLKDRHSVSLKNKWFDEKGRVYFLFSDQELSNVLDMSVRSTSRYKTELQSYGLIHMERQGLNKRNRIYLLKPESDIFSYNKAVEASSGTDTPILSSPDTPILSIQDTTVLSNQDTTVLSTLSKKNLSNLNFSNEEEEEYHRVVVSFFEKNISTSNAAIEKAFKELIILLPIEIILNEIDYAAKNGARSFSYLEKALMQDVDLQIKSIEQLEQKRKNHSTKKGSSVRSNRFKKDEKLPEWYEKQKEQRKSGQTLKDEITPEYEERRQALLLSLGVASQ